MMDCPQDDEFMARNANLMAKEQEEEAIYESLKANGIPCDGCEELFEYDQLTTEELDDVGLVQLCKDC